jgi:hypothetical protein
MPDKLNHAQPVLDSARPSISSDAPERCAKYARKRPNQLLRLPGLPPGQVPMLQGGAANSAASEPPTVKRRRLLAANRPFASSPASQLALARARIVRPGRSTAKGSNVYIRDGACIGSGGAAVSGLISRGSPGTVTLKRQTVISKQVPQVALKQLSLALL